MQGSTDAAPSSGRTAFWMATTVLAGAVVMSLEMVAFRLYAPYFGYSIYVWGNLICIVMVSLAAGYAMGGWLADRKRTDTTLYVLIIASAAYQLLIVAIVHPLLDRLAQMGELTGTVLATLIVFAPPMVMLACVGPYVVRLSARIGRVGSTAGRVSALSTFGSVAGVLVTVFILVPWLGTSATLKINCAVTAVLGAAGLLPGRRWAPAALIPFVVLPWTGGTTWSGESIWLRESVYNLVRVVGEGDRLSLVLNHAGNVQTIRDRTNTWSGFYYDSFAVGPLLVEAKQLLVLGMGGGGSIVATRNTAPDIEVDAVEIDPAVVEAATQFFGMPRDDARIRIHVADARPWLRRSDRRYDLIHVDLYHGGAYVPFYLVTVEFLECVRDHLSPDGMLMVNVFDTSQERFVLAAMTATLERVFPSLAHVPMGWGSNIVLAFVQPRSIESIRDRLAATQDRPEAVRIAAFVARKVRPLTAPPDAPVFTDDHAPVEPLIRRMLAEGSTRRPG